MFNRLFKRNFPDYWNSYIGHFATKHQNEISTARFVVFDTETTGLDIIDDRILSIGAIAINNGKMDVGDSLELYIKQDIFKAETVEIHGILKEGGILKATEEEAIIAFLNYIRDAILVAHHAAFDVSMINGVLSRMGLPKLKNKVLDTGILFKKTNLCESKEKHYSLDQLSDTFNLKKHDRHTASGDAFLTGLIFLKIVSNLKNSRKLKLKDLFFNSDRRGLL